MIKGSCQCGAVAFTVERPLRDVHCCHCSQCRSWSGHYWAATSAPIGAISFQSDKTLTWYRSSEHAERAHCSACGSSLFYKPEGQGRYAIAAGALDGSTGLNVAKHIFCADKGDYYDIPPGVPALEQW